MIILDIHGEEVYVLLSIKKHEGRHTMPDRKPLQIPQYGGASITSPKQYIDYIIRKKNISFPPIPEYCFILYSASLKEEILGKYPHKMVDIGSRNPTEIYFCRPPDRKAFAVIGEQLGASMAAVVLEELIALGFSTFITTGTTGHPCRMKHRQMNIGDIILVNEALVFEGTSRHYNPHALLTKADPELCLRVGGILKSQGIPFHNGRIATTDALYRETPNFIEEILNLNAVAVDMETSALYTVAAFHQKKICAVLYISDIIVIEDDWDTHVMSASMRRTESIFMDLIDRITAHDNP